MIFENDQIHLTPRELNVLRTRAAQQGTAINMIQTRTQLVQGIVAALDLDRAEDLLNFLDSDTSTPNASQE